MPWNNGPLSLYHGTVGPHARDILTNGIRLACCTLKTDFGKGLYATRIRAHAEIHAQHRYRELLDDFVRATQTSDTGRDPEYAAVIEFRVRRDPLGALDTLAFVQPTTDWLEFVTHCRLPSYGHKSPGNDYDVVFGPMFADDGTGNAIPDCEQISFHTPRAIGALSSIQIHRVP
jgi:hypothetical protein